MSIETPLFDIEKAKDEIKLLVEKYEREKNNNRLESYSEEQTKNDFILRLFKVLGWDVYNDHSNTLTAEEKASRGRVDYGFRIDDIPKFFLEAKSFKAGVDKDEYAFQSINYAWLKGCTWAILTNFEKLIVYNAEWKERLAINCLFISLKYTDFLSNFDQLYLLSYEAFTRNLLDKEAEKWHKKIKKTSIDQQLLQDLTKFREMLTQSIIRRNESLKLTQEELDEVVQKILDRIIFIRTVEDRQIEPPHLRPIIREEHNGNLWKKLAELYRYFDDVYDSNLFSPHECEKLSIGDQELETIIRGLHETEDGSVQYDFGAINVDVLGNVYEQYLGHILKKTKKGASFQNGASKRKEQGIFYTPTSIVDYIVKNTVGSKIAEMGLDWKKIRILDPACGSGSFLIKAFDYLTSQDKQLEQKEELKKELYGTHIATERFGYLKNNIFGVDLDAKAVEIAQLNLMIRATEKKERLPSLQQNIKNGDSLVDDPNVAGNKAFQWKSEFPDIINNGGFDVIIGNPPYIFAREKIDEKQKEFFLKNYETSEYQLNTYILFIERSIKLLKNNGTLGFIIPDAWLKVESAKKLRKFMLENTYIKKIINIRGETFPSVGVESSIFILDKTKQVKKTEACTDLQKLNYTLFSQEEWLKNKNFEIELFSSTEVKNVLDKIMVNTKFLDEVSDIKAGLQAYEKDKGKPKQTKEDVINRPYDYDHKFDKDTFKYLEGKNIGRYSFDWKEKWLRYGEWLAAPRSFNLFSSPRILVREIPANLPYAIVSTYLEEVYLNNRSIINILQNDKDLNLKYILAILNSKLMTFYHLNKSVKAQRDIFPKITLNDLRQFPIKITSTEKRELVIKLVDKMFSLNNKLNELGLKNTSETQKLQEEIKRIDDEIDDVVYEIYDINNDERKIIEKNS